MNTSDRQKPVPRRKIAHCQCGAGSLPLTLLLLLALGSSGCTYTRLAFRALTAPPAPPIEAGVKVDRLGELGLEWQRLAVPDFGAVVAVAGAPCRAQPDELLIAGDHSFAAVRLRGNSVSLLEQVPYPTMTGEIVFTDVDGDGRCEVINQGGGWIDTGVYSLDGDLLWTFGHSSGQRSGVDIMVPAQLDADPLTLEFLVGMNGSGGLFALDHRGAELWRVDAANVFQIEVEDLDGDGTPEILHSDPRAHALARRLDGSLVGPIRFARDPVFALLRRAGEPPLWVESAVERNAEGSPTERLEIRRLDGRLQLDLPLPETGHSPELFWLDGEVAGSSTGLFAAVRTLRATGSRSALMIWDAAGELVYHEILPSPFVSGQTLELAAGPRFVVGALDELLVLTPL